MIAATRREALMGALAVPAVAGLPKWRWRHGELTLVAYDPALDAGRRLAARHEGEALAIEGDPIRFAAALFARRPSLVVGLSRPADALLIEEAAGEAGYRPVKWHTETLRALIQESADKGLVLGWVLARADRG